MSKVIIFFVLLSTSACKTGCSPVLPNNDFLSSSSSCLLDYCCTLFHSTVRPALQGEGLISTDRAAEDLDHLSEPSLVTTPEGRIICKGSVHDLPRELKNSQMLCHGQSQCRLVEEDTMVTQEAARDRARFRRTNPWIISKLLTHRQSSTKGHRRLVESRRMTRRSEASLTTAVGANPGKVSNVLAAYRLWRDANGYGKQNARWGRSSANKHSWGPDRRQTVQRRRNTATEKNLVFSRFSHERREISNSTSNTMRWIIKDQPETDAPLMVPYIAATASGLDDVAGRKPSANGNPTRRKRTHLEGPPRLTTGEDFSPEMKEVLEGYLDWRSKYGYGKLSGRWG